MISNLRIARRRLIAALVATAALAVGVRADMQQDVAPPKVANHLTKNGYDVPVSKPRRVTDTEMSTADVVISIGCNLSDLPAPRGALMKWDDVPALSEHFERADERIRQRVIQLVDELVRRQQR
jgi:protein-tyrosine-phosphatase